MTALAAPAAPPAPRVSRAPRPAGITRAVGEEIDVKVAGLSKVFRDFWFRARVRAVDNLSFEVRRGEVFGLLGPNGSGKSTTIKMLLGLLKPSAGRIAVLGKRPKDIGTKKRVGYLPEESYLYRFLDARETLDYYGKLFFQSRQQRRERIEMLLDMVGLQAVQHRPVGEYSKGMQRRIGLAQALINDPQLLILDEPTTGMDPLGTRQIKDLILTLAERGKTIVLCSHMLSDVEDVCDRVAIMYGGKLRVQGACDELLTRTQYTEVRTSHASEAALNDIKDVLRRHGLAFEGARSPRQSLESFFLEVVEKARADRVATHGAQSGGSIAAFLSAETSLAGATGEPTGRDLVEGLLAREAPAPEPRPAPTPEAPAEPEAGLISDLLDRPKAAQVAPSPAQAEPENADTGLIQGLLGGEPKDRR
jgi:ABC-2 type transport system ATP-binding protein